MARPTGRQQRFVEYLSKLGDPDNPDRAALAAMRRAVRGEPTANAEIHRYVVPWIYDREPDSEDPWDRRREADAFYLVAALFATHRLRPLATSMDQPWRTNFGASFTHLRSGESQSSERRFVALLNSHVDELPKHLRHAVSLLRSKNVRIDWAQLLRDIQSWDHPDRYIQEQWARSFWAPIRDQEQPNTAEEPTTP